MNDFLTVKKASELVKTSTSSIRRAIKNGDFEGGIKRSPLKPSGFKWLVSRQALTKAFPEALQKASIKPPLEVVEAPSEAPIIFILKEQLAVKDKQIAEFQESQKRNDILQQQMQREILRLKAPEPAEFENQKQPNSSKAVKQNKKGFWASCRQNRV